MKSSKLAGITVVRNEELIIRDTLDHFGQFCDAIYVYDDCSTDRTAEICKGHDKVKRVIQGEVWDPNRYRAQTMNRSRVLQECQIREFDRFGSDWIICFDADERVEFHFKVFYDLILGGGEHWFRGVDAVRVKLFDFYITPEDVDRPYREREWLGPEYREIIMMYKNSPYLEFNMPGQREVTLGSNDKILNTGYVRHYGKAISVEEWEKTCEYYTTYFGEPFRSKWERRKGRAIHTMSDFGRPLIKWGEKDEKGVRI